MELIESLSKQKFFDNNGKEIEVKIHKTKSNKYIIVANCSRFDFQIPDSSIDFVFEDPPYDLLKGHKIETGIDFDKTVKQTHKILKDNCFFAFFCQDGSSFGMESSNDKFRRILYEHKDKFTKKETIQWIKNTTANPFADVLGRMYETINIYIKGNTNKQFEKTYLSYVKQIKNKMFYSLQAFASFESKYKEMKHIFKKCNCEYKLNFTKQQEEYIQDMLLNNDLKKYYNIGRETPEIFSFKPFKNKDNIYLLLDIILKGLKPKNIYYCEPHNKQDSKKIKHPTVKPIDLCEYILSLCTKKGDIIFDGFLGSGTTALACIKHDRNFIGCEIDKTYFDVANQRIEDEINKDEETLFSYDYEMTKEHNINNWIDILNKFSKHIELSVDFDEVEKQSLQDLIIKNIDYLK